MPKTCTTCGQRYPDEYITCTCRFCGGLIEQEILNLDPKVYEYEIQWHEWRKKYKAAPPRPLRDDDWYYTCGYFNHCAICGSSIDEKLLVIPPRLGGKLYTYNVLPSCEACAKRIRQSQLLNPIKSFYTISGSNKQFVDLGFRYLEAQMKQVNFENFNFDEDELEIIITCPEDTSALPFSGIYAKRVFTEPQRQVMRHQFIYTADKKEEVEGITWRLL